MRLIRRTARELKLAPGSAALMLPKMSCGWARAAQHPRSHPTRQWTLACHHQVGAASCCASTRTSACVAAALRAAHGVWTVINAALWLMLPCAAHNRQLLAVPAAWHLLVRGDNGAPQSQVRPAPSHQDGVPRPCVPVDSMGPGPHSVGSSTARTRPATVISCQLRHHALQPPRQQVEPRLVW